MEPCQENQARLEVGARRVISADANTGVMPVRFGFGLDLGALTAWMAENVMDFAGPLDVYEFRGRQSNPTYKLVTPDKAYVLRRKPPGTLAEGAHAVEREARVMSAHGKAGFPVPQLHGVYLNDAVIGSWFFVMYMVEGRMFWDATLPQVTAKERPTFFKAMNATLARLYQIDPKPVRLEDFGRGGNCFERQTSRWTRSHLSEKDAGRDPVMDKLIETLPRVIPKGDQATIVHGELRCDNLISHPTETSIIAVLDWELSSLGHPLADFTDHAMMYRMPPQIVAGLGDVTPTALNILDRAVNVTQYYAATGRAGIPDYDFCIAFNLFRIAAIFYGIKGRAIRGSAASAHSVVRVERCPTPVKLAQDAAEAYA